MKKFLALLMAATLMMAVLAGCGGTNNGSNAGNTTNNTTTNNSATNDTANNGAEDSTGDTAALSGTVNTDGSTSMKDVMGVLTETYRDVQPDVTVNYSGTGSGAGIEAVLAGNVDIGLSSRALKPEEEEKGAVGHTVALDGVAIVVNPANGVEDLSVEQIAQIFKGEITNWSELGGEDLEIAVYGREAGSGTRGAFEEIVGVEDACKYTNEYESTGEVIGSVAGNPNAIGYASLSAVEGKDTVKAVTVGGVACTEATVLDGSYAIQRPFVLVTKTGETLSPAAQAFFDYATSSAASLLIKAAGAVPVAK